MKQSMRKIIAPVVIVALLLAVLFGYGITVIAMPMPVWIKVIFGIVLVSLSGVGIYVLVQRIQEIRSGEEDDLSHY